MRCCLKIILNSEHFRVILEWPSTEALHWGCTSAERIVVDTHTKTWLLLRNEAKELLKGSVDSCSAKPISLRYIYSRSQSSFLSLHQVSCYIYCPSSYVNYQVPQWLELRRCGFAQQYVSEREFDRIVQLPQVLMLRWLFQDVFQLELWCPKRLMWGKLFLAEHLSTIQPNVNKWVSKCSMHNLQHFYFVCI